MKRWILLLTLIGGSIVFAGYRTDIIDRMDTR